MALVPKIILPKGPITEEVSPVSNVGLLDMLSLAVL